MHRRCALDLPPFASSLPGLLVLRRLTAVCAVLAVVVSCARPTRLTQGTPRDQLYSSLIGHWQGVLEYKDYQDATRRVRLATQLHIVPAPDEDGLELRYTYEDGPGKTVTSIDHLHVDRAMRNARLGSVTDKSLQRFSIIGRAGGVNGAPLRLVFEGDGLDDKQPAQLRETFEISAGAVRLLKETRVAGGPMAFRHVYALRRAE